ncbi:MAG: nitrous oxide reductase family maturation protein NosD, partial [Oscillospiraceae bacterium]
GNIIRDNNAAGNGRFDIARVWTRNIISGNVCGESLPPWLCKGFADVQPEAPDSTGGTEPCAIADLRVPADYPTIQQAVDAASPGDIISVGSGVYREQVTVNKNCLKIVGEEGAVLDGGGRLDSGFTLEGTSGVEIRSFCIRNYRLDGVSVLGGGQNTVSGTSIFNIINYGIFLDTATINNRICGCRIEGAYNGVYDSSSNLHIENSRMSYNGNYGVYGRRTGTKIIKSEVENNIGGGIVHIGSGVRITECRISRNMYNGISVQDDCIIENCEACFNARIGIELNRGNNLVKDNLLSSNGIYGIFSAIGNSIVGNRADNNKLYGIYVTDNNYVQSNTAHGNTIYDIVRNGINSLFHDNHCDSCLPPWICAGVLTSPKMERQGDAEEAAATIVVPDDYPTIQGAVDAAIPGDVILVKEGTYSEQVTIVQSRIKIIGEEQTVLDGGRVLEHGFIVSGTFDVEIRSFTILNYTSYGISVTESSHEIVLSDISAMNCYYGMHLDSGTSNCRITGCSVIGSGHIGIYGLTDNLVIENCDISYNPSSAIVTDCSTSAVRSNTIHNNLGYGINNQVNNNAVITGNSLYENRGTCLAAYGFSAIRGNEVFNNYSKGISANQRCIVERNRCVGNGDAGIIADGECCVKNNDVRDNLGYGLAVYYAGNVVAHNTAVQNKNYDIVINQSGNWTHGNTCGKSVPPWACGECRADQGNQPETREENGYGQN